MSRRYSHEHICGKGTAPDCLIAREASLNLLFSSKSDLKDVSNYKGLVSILHIGYDHVNHTAIIYFRSVLSLFPIFTSPLKTTYRA